MGNSENVMSENIAVAIATAPTVLSYCYLHLHTPRLVTATELQHSRRPFKKNHNPKPKP